ncbi:MAG: topoisomerase DNA-binding C4 zinc finger domain-containing protein [Nitrospinales bacterium]
MSLDYTIFKATDEKSEKNKNRNYFDFNPHLKFLIDRYGPEDVELTRDIMKMLGELSAQHLALKAEENDREGCKLQWCVGEQILTDAEYQKFNELQSVESYQPSDSQDKVDKAVTAFRNNDKIPIRSDVVLPQGAREQIKLLREQDLFGLPLPEKYGGTALSQMIAGAALFFYSQADSSLMLRVMLTEGVADLIENFATEELKEKFIPALCSGQSEKSYTGAMVITEPDAGSDLRGISVKAVKKGEGYLLGGRKIFITNPDAEVLIVLARIEGARPGTLKGLTLFLVPKYLSGEDGEKVDTEQLKDPCPDCGGELKLKTGRFGKFIACSNYPECKFTKTYQEKIDMKCPDCAEGEVVVKKTRKGRVFYGCSRYPDCKYASWTKPVEQETNPK